MLFWIKFFSRNIKETTLARCFTKVTARPSFTRLRVIRRIKYLNGQYLAVIHLYLLLTWTSSNRLCCCSFLYRTSFYSAMILLRSSFTFGEQVTDTIKKGNMAALAENLLNLNLIFSRVCPSRHTTLFQRLKDVYTTSPTSYRRLIDVETTSCVYWAWRKNVVAP